MGKIDHLLLPGETVERELPRVNARLPFTENITPGTLYLTDRRLLFRSKILFNETVHDVPYGQIGAVMSSADGLTAADVTVTTLGGNTARFAVKYDAAPALVSAIRAHQTASP